MKNRGRGAGKGELVVGNGWRLRVGALAAAALIALAGCHTAEEKCVEDETVKVLMIGNSFSISCLTCLPQVAADCGKKLDLGSLYIGGCPIERHVENVAAERKDAAAKGAYRYDRVTDDGRRVVIRDMRLTDALRAAKWDVVTIQQASHLSWQAASYEPWGDELVKTVRELAPQAKVVVQETWSYTPFDGRLKKWKISADEMYARLSAAYRGFSEKRGFDVIPMGEAVQAWRRRLPVRYTDRSFGGDVVGGRYQKPEDLFKRNADMTWSCNSDPFHLNAKGEYLQALVWAAKLLDADLGALKSHPDCVTDDEAKLMREIAMEVAK